MIDKCFNTKLINEMQLFAANRRAYDVYSKCLVPHPAWAKRIMQKYKVRTYSDNRIIAWQHAIYAQAQAEIKRLYFVGRRTN